MNELEIEVNEALARGYCSVENSGKQVDSILIAAMAKEIMPLIERKVKKARIEGLKSILVKIKIKMFKLNCF